MQQQSNDCASTMLARSVAISMVDQEPYPRTAFRPFSQFQHELGNRFYELDRYPQLTHLRHVVEIFKRLIDRQRAIAQDTLNLTVESEPEPPVQPPAQVLSMQFPVMERQMVTFSCMSIVEFLHGCEGLSIDEKVSDSSIVFSLFRSKSWSRRCWMYLWSLRCTSQFAVIQKWEILDWPCSLESPTISPSMISTCPTCSPFLELMPTWSITTRARPWWSPSTRRWLDWWTDSGISSHASWRSLLWPVWRFMREVSDRLYCSRPSKLI